MGKLILPAYEKNAIVVGCPRGSSLVMANMSCAISSSVIFNEKMPKCLAFSRCGRRLHCGIVPFEFSKVGMSFGP
jgi:hypothetical protein